VLALAVLTLVVALLAWHPWQPGAGSATPIPEGDRLPGGVEKADGADMGTVD